MSYEQFLKQLRRIGRQFMIVSIVPMIVIMVAVFIGLLDWELACEIVKVCTIGFLIGLLIYPVKGEE